MSHKLQREPIQRHTHISGYTGREDDVGVFVDDELWVRCKLPVNPSSSSSTETDDP